MKRSSSPSPKKSLRSLFMRIPPEVLFCFILIITFVTHTSYISNGFVWLDHGDIERQRAIVPLDQLHTVFVKRFGDTGFYRPTVALGHSIDSILYGQFAPGYHLSNVLLHVGVTAMVPFFLALFFPFSVRQRLFAMLLFGVHPLSWLPVGGISYRPELLMTLFTMVTVWCHAQSRITRRSLWYVCTLFSMAIGIGAKETAVVLIPLFILLWEIVHSLVIHMPLRQVIRLRQSTLFISEGVILLLYILLRMQVVPEVWRVGGGTASVTYAIGTRFVSLGNRVGELFSPMLPKLSDAVSLTAITHPAALISIILLLFCFVIIAKYGLRNVWSRALLLLLISLAPAANIIPTPRFNSPHYGYIATISFSALVVLFLSRKWSPLVRQFLFGVVTLWVTLMVVTTFRGGFRFENDESLFLPEVVRDQYFLEGHFYLGNYYLMQQDYSKAAKSYDAALHHDERRIAYVEKGSTLINYATVKAQQKQFDDADTLLILAEKTANASDIPFIRYNRALLASKKNDYKKVVALLESYEWYDKEPLLLYAEALARLKKYTEAIDAFHKVSLLLAPEQQQVIKQHIEQLEREHAAIQESVE